MEQLAEILAGLTVWQWAAIIVGVATVLENVSKLKVWSWLLGSVGKKLNGPLEVKVDALTKSVAEVRAEVEDNGYKATREKILDFAGALMNGKEHSKDQFVHILEVITEYETKFASKHNGEMKQTIAFIRDAYDTYMRAAAQDNRAKKKAARAAV